MIIDLKKLLKKCQARVSGGLDFSPTSPKMTLAEGLGAPVRDDKSKEFSGLPSDSLWADSEDPSLQPMRWDLFFNGLTNPLAMPAPNRSPRAGSNGQDVTANAEDVVHFFAGSEGVQTLKAHLNQVPEIRQEQVDWLKQVMAEGRYQMQPQQVAAAMLADGGFNLC